MTLFLNEIIDKVYKYIEIKKSEIENLVNKYTGNIKDFALSYRKNKNFGLAIQIINGKEIYSVIKNYILKNTNKLLKARTFLKDEKL